MRYALVIVVGACGTPPAVPASGPPSAQQRSVATDAAFVTRTDAGADSATSELDASDSGAHAGDEHDACEAQADSIATADPLAVDRDERELTITLRRQTVHHACEESWSTRTLAERLSEIDELAARITSARKRPAKLACKHVVAAHYGDPRWRGKLDGFSTKERTRMIADSRTRMVDACERESWSEIIRACIVARGDRACFEAARMGLVWGYPAAGTVTSLGMSECDDYGAAVASVTACPKLDEQSRAALRRSFESMQAHLASLPRAERMRLGSSCRAGEQSVRDIATRAGC